MKGLGGFGYDDLTEREELDMGWIGDGRCEHGRHGECQAESLREEETE
jgi:hypothetical protein